jgi:tetratricopeptide (TPR) repeat protein
MTDRRLHASRTPAILAMALAVIPSWPITASAQLPPPPAPLHPAQFDPAEVYFQGYLAAREAEDLEKNGDFVAASEKFQRACKLFDTVSQHYPDWKPDIVSERSAITRKALDAVTPKAEELLRKDRGVIAELEGGIRNPATLLEPGDAPLPQAPGILEVDPLTARKLAETENEVRRLRLQLQATSPENREAARNAGRLDDLQRQRDLLQSQLRAAETEANTLRSRINNNPVEQEISQLNERIRRTEQERDAMSMALDKSRGEHTRSMAEIATLEADLKAMQTQARELRQQAANLERDKEKEREISGEVVRGQQRQIQDLEKALELRGKQLTQANDQIAGLRRELTESRDAYAQLHEEHNALLLERDQMAALLKLDEAGRIQDLVEQNMATAKQLREAREQLELLNLDNNHTKDQYNAALNKLTIAKHQINRLQQERRAQDQRIADLEKRLRSEESAIGQGLATANPAEAEMLREIIKRQLRVQERRRQARDLLVQAVKDLGNQDPRVKEAIDLMDGQEIALTPEEQKLIAQREVDGEFISPFARDRATVGAATADLNRDLESFDRAATKAFVAGRLLPTRELYQFMLESHPGHTPALCKLGVVHLRLEDHPAAADTFRRAIELNPENPYAHRMLGVSLMHLGDLPAAEQSVKQATELAADDAKNHSLLGTITFRLGRPDDAESHFRAAITADPMPSEPYFNLAYLCSSNKARHEEARLLYEQALERGAIPDPNLEKLIHQQ